MSKVIMLTSFKGGVGKTTVSANLAMSLAKRGNSVVAVDCDLESRCLDIVLGLEDISLYNISDILSGRCAINEATLIDSRCDKLHFIPAPAYYNFLDDESDAEKIKEEAVRKFISELQVMYDYVILDLPARPDKLYRCLAKCATHAIVVSLHTSASIRAAEKTAMMLSDMSEVVPEDGLFNVCDGTYRRPVKLKTRLVINCFRADAAASGKRPKIYDIVVKASTRLLGVIPYDDAVAAAQEKGKLAYEVRKGRTPFSMAVENIAARCEGEQVLLLKDVKIGASRIKLI